MARKQVSWQEQPKLQWFTRPTFNDSAGKLGPCLSSAVRALGKLHSPAFLSFSLAVLGDDAVLTLGFEHSQGLVLGILTRGFCSWVWVFCRPV
jgi:hypothetical protein